MKNVNESIDELAKKMAAKQETRNAKGQDFTSLSPDELEEKMNRLQNRFASPVTRLPAAYAARLAGKATNPLTFELKALSGLVAKIYKQKGIDFDPERFSPKIIRAMIAWFRGESDPLPQNKGICLQGHTGCGKTVPFEVMQVVSRNDKGKAFGIVKAKAMKIKAMNDMASKRDVLPQYSKSSKNLCIDDLGEESILKYMGNEFCTVGDVIDLRYDLWRKQGTITHFTTNLEPKELQEKYGDRVYRRLLEMCVIVPVG